MRGSDVAEDMVTVGDIAVAKKFTTLIVVFISSKVRKSNNT